MTRKIPPIANPLARLSPAKTKLVMLSISRESVVAGDIQPALDCLAPLSETTESATAYEGVLTFGFDGWDGDPRETAEIPEIRKWFTKLTEHWPFWFHFCEKVGDSIPHVMRLLCSGEMLRGEGGTLSWRYTNPAENRRVMYQLFGGLNRLYFAMDLPESMNKRVTDEVAELMVAAAGD